MQWSTLRGAQYVRLAAGAGERVARYLGVAPEEIEELLLDLESWPEAIHPQPRKGRDGRLIAGDPVLLDACDAGLLLGNGPGPLARAAVLVPWEAVQSVQVLGRLDEQPGA